MPSTEVLGLSISYDVVGHGDGRSWVVTPGGRLGMDTVGIRELATALADAGDRVLIWDRPNGGSSDVCFTGESEAAMWSDVLAELLIRLELGPAVLIGGSGGARLSLTTAVRHPEITAGLGLWWVSGGVYAMFYLGNLYYADSLLAVWNGGMQAVAELPEWQAVIERNPANRQRFLDQDPAQFRATFQRWMHAFNTCEDDWGAGIAVEQVRGVNCPVLIFRNGISDMNHPRATSDRLAELLPDVRVVDPPWLDTEWIDRKAAGEVGFVRWPRLAPPLLAWAADVLGC